MIRRRGSSEELGKDRLQGIRPDLISSHCRVETVDHHAIEQLVLLVRQLVIDVDVAKRAAIREV